MRNKILPSNAEIVVKKSKFIKNQFGILVKKSIKKGQSIFTVKGPIKNKPTKYSFSFSLTEHIEPKRNDGSSDFGHYLNHSCDPNTKLKQAFSKIKNPYIKVIARRNIWVGEELTFDYASWEYRITADKVKCRCGSKICRRVLCGFKDLPENFVQKYKKEGMIPKYLLDLRKKM